MLAGSVRKEASSERSVSCFSAARSMARRFEQPRHGPVGPRDRQFEQKHFPGRFPPKLKVTLPTKDSCIGTVLISTIGGLAGPEIPLRF